MVPRAGLEPAWALGPRDFKSLASTNSAIPAHNHENGGGNRNRTDESRICSPLPYHLAMPPIDQEISFQGPQVTLRAYFEGLPM